MLIDYLETDLIRMSEAELLEWLFEERFFKRERLCFHCNGYMVLSK